MTSAEATQSDASFTAKPKPFLNDRNFEIVGLPSAVFNRKRLVSPTAFNQIQEEAEAVIGCRSAAKVAIDRVDCDFESGECRVDFTASLALPFPNADISAATVLIADNLQGYGPKWFQTDYYSGTSEQAFLKDADESWWPYMKFYCEYPSKNISPTDMAFNHVGMGIYPYYNGDGCLLPSDWSASKSASASISFTMPMQEEVNEFGVQDINDNSIAVLVFNHSSGEILTAAKVHASDYNKELLEVDTVKAPESISIDNAGFRLLSVSTPEDGHVDIYLRRQTPSHAADQTWSQQHPCVIRRSVYRHRTYAIGNGLKKDMFLEMR